MATNKSPFITAYGPKNRIKTNFSADSRTKQSFKDECDVNNIMARYVKTGLIDFTNRNEGRYGDCTGQTFQAAMEIVASANSMFHELPARIRDRFMNEPKAFLDFVNNPNNEAEARELGLLKPKAPAPAAPAEPAAAAPAAAAATAGGGQGGGAPT